MTEQERIKELEHRLKQYETNGSASLFYALNKKMNEMAAMLNKQNLANLDLADAKDKSFDRLKVIWQDASNIAAAVKTLGEIAGVTNDETSDTNKPIYRKNISPESIADSIGEIAGQKKEDV